MNYLLYWALISVGVVLGWTLRVLLTGAQSNLKNPNEH